MTVTSGIRGHSHGILIVSGFSAYLIWVAGDNGQLDINRRRFYGTDSCTFTVNKSTGTWTVSSDELSGFVYFGN